jgi:hypothetical protein
MCDGWWLLGETNEYTPPGSMCFEQRKRHGLGTQTACMIPTMKHMLEICFEGGLKV